MTDFTADDLFDAIDRQVLDLLARNRIEEPPIDAVVLAQEAFGLTVVEADDEDEAGQFGPRPPRRRSREIVLRIDHSPEARNAICARACAKEMLPTLLEKLGVAPGTENRGAQTTLIGQVAPRLLLPTRWFEKDARKAGFDLFALKERYATVGYEMIALRMLDLVDDTCVVAIVDDGTVSVRRGNRAAAGKQLTAAENLCLEKVLAEQEPQKARRDDWTTHGWPIPTGPFNRIILRSVPDDV